MACPRPPLRAAGRTQSVVGTRLALVLAGFDREGLAAALALVVMSDAHSCRFSHGVFLLRYEEALVAPAQGCEPSRWWPALRHAKPRQRRLLRRRAPSARQAPASEEARRVHAWACCSKAFADLWARAWTGCAALPTSPSAGARLLPFTVPQERVACLPQIRRSRRCGPTPPPQGPPLAGGAPEPAGGLGGLNRHG